NDVMKMRPVEGGIEIPAGGSVELKPGGYHVMLMQLPRDLLPGQAIMLTLVFESGVELPVAVPVYDKMGSMSMGH
ncbi:MAG: copper chaperone PCu(A)C, partial [Chloroflexi bacterium]|nr:copper chaperone PCu(A)C [Chloroflexota bacterium]MDL1883875.1 copper chaperone PCu(A)C [Anaerolineae bacterium CFX8]